MYPRLGLKTAVTNYADGWGEKYLMPLIRAGIPPVVGALDGAGFAYEAQEAMREAGWSYEKQRQATIVYRNTENDIPDYQLSPQDAADRQWEWHNARWPRELDRRIVYGGITLAKYRRLNRRERLAFTPSIGRAGAGLSVSGRF